MIRQGEKRFAAEWVSQQFRDKDGEWKPDCDTYVTSVHQSKSGAEQAAIRGSKRSGIEWILVAEQEYRNREWVDVHRWTGDWDGLHDQTFPDPIFHND